MSLNLVYPHQSDYYDVELLNENFRKVDEKASEIDSKNMSLDERLENLEDKLSLVDEILATNINVQQKHDETVASRNEVVNITAHFQTQQNESAEELTSLKNDVDAIE